MLDYAIGGRRPPINSRLTNTTLFYFLSRLQCDWGKVHEAPECTGHRWRSLSSLYVKVGVALQDVLPRAGLLGRESEG